MYISLKDEMMMMGGDGIFTNLLPPSPLHLKWHQGKDDGSSQKYFKSEKKCTKEKR
jgi:hypothetical protein